MIYNKNVCNIKVIGIGGGGSNAVNRMIKENVTSCNFAVINTDAQALNSSFVNDEDKILIGTHTTEGMGAGAVPERGKEACEEAESIEKIKQAVDGVKLLFITAGMGGGTGTGASPVVAKIAKEKGCLTVAVVTKPFGFEGVVRKRNAEAGIQELKKYVDTIIIIPNDRLKEVYGEKIQMTEAMRHADETLQQGVQGIADLINVPGLINLDFADIKTIMENKGVAHMGIGTSTADKDRVIDAVRKAVGCPLLETNIIGASGVIINVIGGRDMTLGELELSAKLVQEVVSPEANIIFGGNIIEDESYDKKITVTVVATGLNDNKVLSGFAKDNSQFVLKNNNNTVDYITNPTVNNQTVNKVEEPKVATPQPIEKVQETKTVEEFVEQPTEKKKNKFLEKFFNKR